MRISRVGHKKTLTLYVYFEEPVAYKELVKYSKRRTTELEGQTPLTYAEKFGNTEIVQYLKTLEK